MENSSKNKLENLKDEDLVMELQEDFDRDSIIFKTLFKRCSKKLYKFLIRKGFSKFDSEDLLQDYFSSYNKTDSLSDFEKAVKSFDPSYKGKFVNYIKRILVLRLITKKQQIKTEKSVVVDSINNKINNGDDSTDKSYFVGKEDSSLNSFILDEMKKIIINHIFEIENEKYKTALICRLCLPFKLPVSEIAEILEINERSLATYIYRGIKQLSIKITNDDKLKNLDYNKEISKFIEYRLLHLNKSALNQVFTDNRVIEIFEKLLYEGKSIEELSKILCINIIELKKIIREGIFKLINDKKSLLQ